MSRSGIGGLESLVPEMGIGISKIKLYKDPDHDSSTEKSHNNIWNKKLPSSTQ